MLHIINFRKRNVCLACLCECVCDRLRKKYMYMVEPKLWTLLFWCRVYAIRVFYCYSNMFVLELYETLQFSHWLFVCLWYWWKERMNNNNNNNNNNKHEYREIAFNNTISTNQRLRGHIEIKKNKEKITHSYFFFLICVLCLFIFLLSAQPPRLDSFSLEYWLNWRSLILYYC